MTQKIENCKENFRWVADTRNFSGHAKTYLPDGNACPYTGKTAAEYLAEGFSILTNEEFAALVTAYENNLCGHWAEESEEQYEDMLNVLPPVAWYNGGFFMSERWMGDISGFHQEFKGKFYTSLQRMSTPRANIIESLAAFVKEAAANA